MAPAAKARPAQRKTTRKLADLSDDEPGELLGLLKGADSVELKLTVPDADHRSAIAELKLDPLDAQIRQVFFFDTPDLALNKAGIVARARRVQGKVHDSVVKLRPSAPRRCRRACARTTGVNVEVDAMPGGWVCSASLKRELKPDRIAGRSPASASCGSCSRSSSASSTRSTRPPASSSTISRSSARSSSSS